MVPRPTLGGDSTFLYHGLLGRGVLSFAPQHLTFKILYLYYNNQNIFKNIFIYLYLNLINSIMVNYYFLMLWVTIDIEYLRIFF